MMQVITYIWRSFHPARRKRRNALPERAFRVPINYGNLVFVPKFVWIVVCVERWHIVQLVYNAWVINSGVFRRLVVNVRRTVNIQTLQDLMEFCSSVHGIHLPESG